MTTWTDFNDAATAPAATSLNLKFCTGFGQSDTHAITLSDGRPNPHKSAGTDYQGITGKEIVNLIRDPANVPKNKAQWFIPSTYRASDARNHAPQAQNGEYWFLCLDEDGKGNNLSIEEIEASVRGAVGESIRLIYSTKSSTAEKRKWRVILPLWEPIKGADYSDTVDAFNALLIESSEGTLIPDPALNKTGQLIYLPNRGEHYEHKVHKGDRLHLSPDHPIIQRREAMRAERAEATRIAKERGARRRAKALTNPESKESTIEVFNQNTTVAAELERYGYTSSRNGKDWKSPNSSTGSYAVRDYGNFWISLSGSDADLEIGNLSPSGARIGDAFDLFVHFEHGGDFTAAVRTAAENLGIGHKSTVKDDHHQQEGKIEGEKAATPEISPTTFSLRPSHQIPPRQWLYGKHLIRGFLSLTVAPGGVGKSSMVQIDALSMATGRGLLGATPPHPLRVWVWNGEDPNEESERRIAAACIHYGITNEDLGGRLCVDSGRELPITLATMTGGAVQVAKPVSAKIKAAIKAHKIDVLIVDPFVTSHEVSENDNTAINAVASEWRRIADETGCAIELVHHTSKAGAFGDDLGIYASRGGGALIDAVRAARYLVRMTSQEAERFGIDETEARVTFRVCTDGKANLAPPEKATWRRMVSVSLGNGSAHWPEGDHVGVCTMWTPPDAFEGVTARDLLTVQEAIEIADDPRESDKGPTWAGFVVGDALGYDLGCRHSKKIERTSAQNAARAKVRIMLRDWIKSGALAIEENKDAKGKPLKTVVIGQRVRADEL